MLAVAAILSIVLFLAFATSGLQKVLFNPVMSGSAEHLGFTKSAFQRIGTVEIAGALGLMLGLAAKGSTWLGVINEAAAVGLVVAMALAVVVHVRKGDPFKMFTPAMALGVLALAELIFRLA